MPSMTTMERRDEFLYSLDEMERRPWIVPMEKSIAGVNTANVPIDLPGKFNVWVKKIKGWVNRVPVSPDVELVNASFLTLQLTSKPHNVDLFEEPITFANLFGVGENSELIILDPAWRLQPDGNIKAQFATVQGWPDDATSFGICLFCELHDPAVINKQKDSE